MSSTDTIPFFAIGETDLVEADTIVLERVPSGDPNEADTFKVTYTANGTSDQRVAWVSYHVYCMLRSVEKQRLAELNTSADTLG